jgi:hypothetical protein
MKLIVISLGLLTCWGAYAIEGKSLEPHTHDATSTDIMGGGTPGHMGGGSGDRRVAPDIQHQDEDRAQTQKEQKRQRKRPQQQASEQGPEE